MAATIFRKRKHIAVISSDDESPGPIKLCKEEKEYDISNLPDCKVVLSKMIEDVGKQERKRPRRIRKKFHGESSDDESEGSNSTPSKIQVQRKRLEKLCEKRKNKTRPNKRLQETSSSSQESEPEDIKTEMDNEPLYTEEEEQRLPMFQHEEKPPDSDMSSEDDKNFINDDESIDCSSNSESEEGSLKSSEESSAYINPYMERNNDFEREDIMKILSKSTEKDKNNQKRYKKEIGKYQLKIHTETNRALLITNKQRYDKNMALARHDEALKEERNIERGDDDFFYSTILTISGDKVQVFPHTKRSSRYSSRCDLHSCNEKFTTGQTLVVGIKKFSEFDLRFRKKPNKNSNKESFYWICASHCPSHVWQEESSPSSDESE